MSAPALSRRALIAVLALVALIPVGLMAATVEPGGALSLPPLPVPRLPGPPPVVPAGPGAYWLVASDGGIFSFGGVPFLGSTGGDRLAQPVAAMAATPDGRGYWLVTADGVVFAFGDADFLGSPAGLPAPSRPQSAIVAMATTPDGGGYWLTAANGSVYSFGDAPFEGSISSILGLRLTSPIAAMAPTSDGGGYWLAARDGSVFSFGDAHFGGSAISLKPIVGMAAGTSGGYWLVASDGGIFSFGSASFYGSTGAIRLNQPIVGMAATHDGGGYWLVASDGGIFSFGDAAFRGSTGARRLNRPIVGMAVGHTLDPYPPGAEGYDISYPQCSTGYPSSPSAFAIIGVNDGRAFTRNPCLGDERAWAGPVLSVYVNLNAPPAGSTQGLNGPAGQCPAGATGCVAYNYGYNAAADAFTYGTSAGVSSSLWWLDVETANTWDTDTANNARTIQGALDALGADGVVVGIYSTAYQWGVITGGFTPKTPIWVATGSDYPTAVSFCGPDHAFGGGTAWLTQYGSTGSDFDLDHACPVS